MGMPNWLRFMLSNYDRPVFASPSKQPISWMLPFLVLYFRLFKVKSLLFELNLPLQHFKQSLFKLNLPLLHFKQSLLKLNLSLQYFK